MSTPLYGAHTTAELSDCNGHNAGQHPDGMSREAMCQLTVWEMNANGFPTLPAATAPTSCPSSSPCQFSEKKMNISTGAHFMSQWPRKECVGKAWHCANDAEPESKKGWKGGRCDLGLLWQPQFFPYCALPGSLGTWDCLELDHRHGSLFPTSPFSLRRQWFCHHKNQSQWNHLAECAQRALWFEWPLLCIRVWI